MTTEKTDNPESRIWQPTLSPKLRATAGTESAIKRANSKLGLTVQAVVDDPDYGGPIRSMVSTMGDPGGGGYPDSFLSITIYGKVDETLVQFFQNDVYVYDPGLTKIDIANAAESFRDLVRRLGLSNTCNSIYGAVASPDDLKRYSFPEDQVPRDANGDFLRNKSGHIVVLWRKFQFG